MLGYARLMYLIMRVSVMDDHASLTFTFYEIYYILGFDLYEDSISF
jgi:hypothetical protein